MCMTVGKVYFSVLLIQLSHETFVLYSRTINLWIFWVVGDLITDNSQPQPTIPIKKIHKNTLDAQRELVG